GTSVVVAFQQPTAIDSVRKALDQYYPGGGQNTIINNYGDPGQRQIMIRVPTVGAERGAALSVESQKVQDALKKANVGGFSVIGPAIVGPAVGQELRRRGLWSTVLSLIFLLAYLAFRFQFSFGVGAVVATIHDLLITFAFLVFFRYDMTLNVIAAIL